MNCKEAAKQFTPGGKTPSGVVVAVPCFWTERRRQVRMAGWPTARILLHPVSQGWIGTRSLPLHAAWCCSESNRPPQHFLSLLSLALSTAFGLFLLPPGKNTNDTNAAAGPDRRGRDCRAQHHVDHKVS